jgi:hypothetical protein
MPRVPGPLHVLRCYPHSCYHCRIAQQLTPAVRPASPAPRYTRCPPTQFTQVPPPIARATSASSLIRSTSLPPPPPPSMPSKTGYHHQPVPLATSAQSTHTVRYHPRQRYPSVGDTPLDMSSNLAGVSRHQ